MLNSADMADQTRFAPRYFLKNTTLLASPPLAYVSTTGNDGTGDSVDRRIDRIGFAVPHHRRSHHGAQHRAVRHHRDRRRGLRLGSGSFAMGSVPSGFAVQKVAALTVTRDPAVAREDAIATIGASNIRMRFYGSFTGAVATGAIRFRDVTVKRTGAGTLQGETSGYLDIFHDDMDYDGGSVSSISLFRAIAGGWAARSPTSPMRRWGQPMSARMRCFAGSTFPAAVGLAGALRGRLRDGGRVSGQQHRHLARMA